MAWTLTILFAWLMLMSWPHKGKTMNVKLTSQFTRSEIDKAATSLFDLFAIELPASVKSTAIRHLRDEYNRACDERGLSDSETLTVLASFDRGHQVLQVFLDNSDGYFNDGYLLRIDAFCKSFIKLFPIKKMSKGNGTQRLA